MDDSIKQALLSRFRTYLDTAEGEGGLQDDAAETADLYSLFVEVAGLRSEVRTESRLVKEALDQFRRAFDTLQSSHTAMQQELERTRAEARDQERRLLRPLLLDVIDLRDRLAAALKLAAAAQRHWQDRLLRRNPSGGETWREGLRMTLRRLDQVLLDRHVVATPLTGHPFDPRLARVVGTSVDSSVAEGTVIEEVRGGYLWDDQVLRTAEVIVSKRDVGNGELS